MVAFILPANSATGGYDIDNSIRFENGDSPDLRFDGQMAAGNRRTFTYSFWTKRGNLGINTCVFSVEASDVVFRFGTSDDIQFKDVNNDSFNLSTNNVFKDTSAWYHIVVAVDTTDGTAANRIKLYVNGTQQTANFGTETYPSQNHDTEQNNNGDSMYIGARTDSATEGSSMTQHYDGYIADFHLIDGEQKAASDFGETNNNGVWIPKEYDGSYGTNGFKLEFKQTGTSADASGKGADTSGQGNHFDDTNMTATEITVDTPTNNFATMNPVHKSTYGSVALPTFSEGNLKLAMNSDSSTSSTIAPSKGKWYVEYKQGENTADNGGYPIVGISATLGGTAGDVIGFRTPSGTDYRGQLGTTSVSNAFGSARSANDIFGFYINLDDDILIVHKNGSDYMGSGASSGLNWSGGLTTTNTQTGFYHFYVQNNQDGTPAFTDEVNFGNPTFSISSSNADANGYGSFEYSPTLSGTNYYALCTKNLAEYG
jgi:3D (Asp-Asp-Asp) domain-containing protein